MRNVFKQNCNTYLYFNKKIYKLSIIDFHTKLSYELWEDIFAENNANAIFNNFLNKFSTLAFLSKKFIINPVTRHG